MFPYRGEQRCQQLQQQVVRIHRIVQQLFLVSIAIHASLFAVHSFQWGDAISTTNPRCRSLSHYRKEGCFALALSSAQQEALSSIKARDKDEQQQKRTVVVHVKKKKNKKPKKVARKRWDVMVERLQRFRKEYGHTIVKAQAPDCRYCCSDDDVDEIELQRRHGELYQWTLSVRRNYRYQVMRKMSAAATSPSLEVNHHSSSSSNNNNDDCDEQSLIVANDGGGEQKPQPRRRPHLSRVKMEQLYSSGFCWDVKAAAWDRQYRKLQAFHDLYGHCKVPAKDHEIIDMLLKDGKAATIVRKKEGAESCKFAGLGVWVRNQRREHRKLMLGQRSTLTHDRLSALERLGFDWFRSHQEAWNVQYQQLVAFYQQHGHSNVPLDYKENNALGTWCMNQRTAYRRYLEGQSSPMTQDRIEQLERIHFRWSYREFKWNIMLQRLSDYYKEHGHIRIPTPDLQNRDLRLWLNLQRYFYNQRQKQEELQESAAPSPSPLLSNRMTDKRIRAMEEVIPGFSWKVRVGDGSGPSSEDWSKLFDAMREKGIGPGMRPKQHWFEGSNPFSVTTSLGSTKETWTEEDLLTLWNQEDDGD